MLSRNHRHRPRRWLWFAPARAWCIALLAGPLPLSAQEPATPPAPPVRVVGPVTGIVRDRAGNPVAGASLVTTVPGAKVKFADGKLDTTPVAELAFATSGLDGSYRLEPPARPTLDQPRESAWFGAFAVHDQGYAKKSADELAVSGDLTLEPWGRVEGTATVLGKPLADVPIQLMLNTTDEHSMGIEFTSYAARTDDRGRYAIARVPAGWVAATTGDRKGKNAGAYPVIASSIETIHVGETLRLAIGGVGRPVVGRFRLPEGAPFHLGGGHLLAIRRPPPRPVAGATPALSPLQRFQAALDRERSPDERAYRRELRASMLQVHPDGTFRAFEVEPGTYELAVYPGDDWRHPIPAGQVIVPPIPGGRTVEPLDLGTIDVRPPPPR